MSLGKRQILPPETSTHRAIFEHTEFSQRLHDLVGARKAMPSDDVRLRGDTIERYLASRSLMTWSVDFAADDWLRISAEEIAERALRRIEARGRGMLLLHDIKPATVLALPIILRELKSRGYRIVHVEPATVDRIKTATLPAQWLARNNGKWPAPELSIEVLLAESVLTAPALSSFGISESIGNWEVIVYRRKRTFAAPRGQIPLPPESPWPRVHSHAQPVTASAPAANNTSVFPADRGEVTSAPLWKRLETAGIMRFGFPLGSARPM